MQRHSRGDGNPAALVSRLRGNDAKLFSTARLKGNLVVVGLNRLFASVGLFCLGIAGGCSVMTPAIQGSGVAATESREVVEFDQIEISIPVQIEISKGNVCTLELTVDDNLMEHISTTVSNGRLHVSADQNFAMKVPGMLRITSPNLTYVSLAGAVDGTIEELSGESAELHMAGSSEVSVGLLTENLSVHIAGSGTLNASGICKTMEVSIAGSGTVHSENVPVDEVSVSIAGSGDVYVHASQKLDVSIAGSGSVRYKGEPVIEQSVAGSGAIEKLN